MNRSFPPAPQTGRHPVTLLPEQERRLLARKMNADRTDPFATDPNSAVRHLGQLALRRDEEDSADFFSLGDMCANLSLVNDRLLIAYVSKALNAYRRAGQIARQYAQLASTEADAERILGDSNLAEAAVRAFVGWVFDIAREAPTPRNIAVALWAATEIAPEQQAESYREAAIELARLYISATTGGSLADTGGRQTTEAPNPFLPPPGDAARPNPPLPEVEDSADLYETQSDALDPADTQSGDSAAPPYEEEDHDTTNWADQLTALAGDSPILASDDSGAEARLSPPASAFAAPSRSREDQGGQDFRPGEQLGDRYEVRHVLRGGMGIIYLCYDHEAGESVAIKTFQGRFLDNERAIARFTQEAHTWIRLEKHNNIVQARKVQTFGSARVRERPHIILEYIAGPEGLGSDLKSWIEHHRLDLMTTAEIGLHICLGMHHAAQRVPGLVHRDLKPANILVRHDGLAKVTDFGLVRSLDSTLERPELETMPGTASESSRLTRAGTVVGTAPYMAPEQCVSGDVDLRADIYAFGAILFEMLTGQRVFKARTTAEWIDAHLYAMPLFPPEITDHIPADLQALTLRCLAKDAADRPATWEALRDELAGIYEKITGKPPVFEVSGADLEVRELMDKAYSLTELGYGQEALHTYDRALKLAPDSGWVWARKGRTLRILEQYEEALLAYDRALALEPGFAWAWSGKGIVLERLGDYALALEAYETASRLRPNDIWALFNQAGLLFNGGQAAEALSRLDQALRLDPNHAPSHVRCGKILKVLKRLDEALRAFERATALDPKLGEAWTGKGLTLRELGRLQEAAAAFMQATRLMPDEIAPWLRLADTLIGLNRHTDALPVIQQAARLRPHYKGVWVRLGRILYRLDRHTEALDAYDRALALKADHAPALCGKGEALERLNRLDEALECYRAAVAASPGQALGLYRLADALAALRRYDDALTALEQLLQINPENKFAWARIGRVQQRRGRQEEAEAAYTRAVTLDPRYGWAWNGLGLALLSQKRYDEALPCFEQATAAHPSRAWYWFNRGSALIWLRRFTDALVMLEHALALDEQYAACWAKRGQALRCLKRYEEAVAAYDRALSISPHYAWAWNGLGLALERLGHHNDAVQSFERAAQEAPRVVWYRLNLVNSLLALGRRAEALETCEEALEIVPADSPLAALVWARKGQVFRRLNHHEEAIGVYERALRLDPHYAWAWHGRGLACAALGRREEALTCFTRAAELAPAHLWFWYHKGEALIELGLYEEAIHTLNRALEIDPLHERARLKRDEARKKQSKT